MDTEITSNRKISNPSYMEDNECQPLLPGAPLLIEKRNSLYDSQVEGNCWYRFKRMIDKHFKVTERGSTFGTEFRAGTVTFLTMSYIVLVNPQVLAASGIPQHTAASSTCIAAAFASLLVGVFGNLPFGCAPGVGLSAYFTYGLVLNRFDAGGIPDYRPALTMSFLAGAICFLAWLTTLSRRVMDSIPETIKLATIVGMGLFLSFVGMWNIRLVTYGVQDENIGTAPVQLGDLTDWTIWLSLAALAVITLLAMYEIKGNLLVGVIGASLVYFMVTGLWPQKLFEIPDFSSPTEMLDFTSIGFNKYTMEGIISFLLILIFDVSGVVFAVGDMCQLMDPIHGHVEGGHWALFAASMGTMFSAATGGSPIIVHLESVAGAVEGGKTGLTAITIALYFAIATFLAPLFGSMPLAATAPVLVYVGTLMTKQTNLIDWGRYELAVPSFLTIVMMPFTFSIANGIFFGLFFYTIFWLATGEFMTMCGFKSWAPPNRKESDSWETGEYSSGANSAPNARIDDPEAQKIGQILKMELSQCRISVERDLCFKLDNLFEGMEHWIKEKYDQVKHQKDNRVDVSRSGGFNATAGGSSFHFNAARARSPSVLSELNLRSRSRSLTPLRARHSYSDSKLIGVSRSRSNSPNYRDDPRAPSIGARHE